ncbi:MAG TPA: lytic transglycosylase domain-containing protein [Candidatus Nanoarchaeia archaeon]|nr:lytic transglycosylase domain-containing protein [Candidatus Nanoarchaeia archaeon]
MFRYIAAPLLALSLSLSGPSYAAPRQNYIQATQLENYVQRFQEGDLRWKRETAKERLPAYDSLFRNAAKAHEVDYHLLVSLATIESLLDPEAKSPAGARGITQIMPRTAPELGLSVQQLFDPVAVIPATADYIAECAKNFGSWELATAAWNAGPTAVRAYLNGNNLPKETREFVYQVEALRRCLKQSEEGIPRSSPSVIRVPEPIQLTPAMIASTVTWQYLGRWTYVTGPQNVDKYLYTPVSGDTVDSIARRFREADLPFSGATKPGSSFIAVLVQGNPVPGKPVEVHGIID